MLTGFNHNIKHDGRIFHIQTEDSGVKAPHVITHVFVGGNIIATKKSSYADVLSSENLEEVVRTLMEEQHKQMLRNLIHGQYDQAASHSVGGTAPVDEAKPEQSAPTQEAGVGVEAEAPAPPAPPEPEPAAPELEKAPTKPSVAPAPVDMPTPPPMESPFPAPPTPAAPPPPPTMVPAPRLVRDVAASEMSSQPQAEAVVSELDSAPLPPTADTPDDMPAVTEDVIAEQAATAAAQPPPQRAISENRLPLPSIWDLPTAADEPPAKPDAFPPEVVAARELTEVPVEKPSPHDTIFGEDLLDEKSLDEVILSYLADDFDL